MRDKSFYKEKAEAIKSDVLDIKKKGAICDLENPYDSYPGIFEAFREFVHVVYSFDKNLPLNKELDLFGESKFMYGFGTINLEKVDLEFIMSQIDFFLHYLEIYTD